MSVDTDTVIFLHSGEKRFLLRFFCSCFCFSLAEIVFYWSRLIFSKNTLKDEKLSKIYWPCTSRFHMQKDVCMQKEKKVLTCSSFSSNSFAWIQIVGRYIFLVQCTSLVVVPLHDWLFFGSLFFIMKEIKEYSTILAFRRRQPLACC